MFKFITVPLQKESTCMKKHCPLDSREVDIMAIIHRTTSEEKQT